MDSSTWGRATSGGRSEQHHESAIHHGMRTTAELVAGALVCVRRNLHRYSGPQPCDEIGGAAEPGAEHGIGVSG